VELTNDAVTDTDANLQRKIDFDSNPVPCKRTKDPPPSSPTLGIIDVNASTSDMEKGIELVMPTLCPLVETLTLVSPL
jgi:hypothetical protein